MSAAAEELMTVEAQENRPHALREQGNECCRVHNEGGGWRKEGKAVLGLIWRQAVRT
jgi:hypothetical protein